MIKYERVGTCEVQKVDLKVVLQIYEIAKLAKDCPDDLRKELVKTISLINSPVIIRREEG